MTKIYKVDYPKEGRYCEDDELSENEIQNIKASNADVAIYTYGTGSYEGDGDLLLMKDGFWMFKSLSHCSCYGPVEEPINLKKDFDRAYTSLDELSESVSKEYFKDLKPLMDKAKELGLK